MTVVDPDPNLTARISASVTNWKRKLLDISKRNRALNFRPTKVSTIAIIDEQPSEVFRHLYLEEGSMRFRATEPKQTLLRPPEDEMQSIGDEAFDLDTAAGRGLKYVPYDPSSTADRHRDHWLQTALSPEALDHSLRRIEEQARTSVEEQGVNTLFLTLGMLAYRDSPESDVWSRAPLILLPVELARKTARADYALSPAAEDALVNPALIEYLRTNQGIQLPDLPDGENIDEAYDLQTFLRGATAAISKQKDWRVDTDVYLCLLAFQKLVMFKDLEANYDAVKKHRLVRQLLARAGSSVHGLPEEVRSLPLDTEFTPETTSQVVDADSSQMRAAAAVAKGHDLVIEGPPGTGKSQTITNLVAQALASGKSVLFVAEKMAALDVVHRRLVQAGLGEFCLELHSSKANKLAVMKALSSALDASLQPVAGAVGGTRRLPAVRSSLAEYVQAAHASFGQLGESPYSIVGKLGLVREAPKMRHSGPVATVTAEQLGEAERALTDLATHAAAIGIPSAHPWRDTSRTFFSEDLLDAVADLSRKVSTGARSLIDQMESLVQTFGVPSATTLAAVEATREVADVLADSPGVASSVLLSDAWNAAPAEASGLIAKTRELQTLKGRVGGRFKPEVFQEAHAEEIAYVERKASGVLGFLAFLDGRYRSISKRWRSYLKTEPAPSMLDQAADLKVVDQITEISRELDSVGSAARQLFGTHWRGASSQAERLSAYVAYVVRFRRMAVATGLTGSAANIAEKARPDVSVIHSAIAAAVELRSELERLHEAVAWPPNYLVASSLPEIERRAKGLAESIPLAPAWAAFEASRKRAEATLAAEAVKSGLDGSVPFEQLRAAFQRAFYTRCMSEAIQSRPALERFDTLSHEQLIKEFRDLDERVIRENRASLVGRLREQAQHRLRQAEPAAALPALRRAMAQQRSRVALRKTFLNCADAIQAIKPCFMMSPLTVAQYLRADVPRFDVVIFDEASQLPIEDAVSSVVRGRQLVVVGDPKQLPPTNFFSVASGTVAAPVDEEGNPLYEDSESVLEEFMGAAVPMSRLKWHYRSSHESLINFSNVTFYEADLHTFPSVVTESDTSGLQFHYVEGGVYEGKGINLVEARRIADEVVAFARQQLLRRARGEAEISLGVGTLNLRQQLAIMDELEVRRREDPRLEPFFDRSGIEPFFVKNLENIQGDERDAIFLSITFGRSSDGRIRYNFGALNRENGWRRLNVLVTRARRQMRVFSSMRDNDINPVGGTSKGPELLRAFLAYAEHRQLGGNAFSAAADTESPFERDVYLELTRKGVRLQPQVGVCGYRIDLGVLDHEAPGRFICGIECDGVAYHSMETVRDRDRLRQKVLEDRGWTIHRVWSTDWFKDRPKQIERLVRLIQDAGDKARSAAATVSQAPEPSRVEATVPQQMSPAAAPTLDRPGYLRPQIANYVFCTDAHVNTTGDLLDAPVEMLARAFAVVVQVEAPVHETDVVGRICAMWDTRAGSRIQAAILKAANSAVQQGLIARRSKFYWRTDGRCIPRSRADTGIPGDRIAPEEYLAVVKLVLSAGHSLPRPNLVVEVRGTLGFSRTGSVLEEAIGNIVDGMVLAGMLGESSTGLVLRTKGDGN